MKVAAGAAVGLAWAVAFRGWMRLISTDPEFSWAGTMFIVVAFTLLAACVELAVHARRRASRWAARAGVALATLPTGMGAGMLFLPTLVAGTGAANAWRLNRAIAIPLGVLAAAPAAVVMRDLEGLPAPRLVFAAVAYAAFALTGIARYRRAWRSPTAPEVIAEGCKDSAKSGAHHGRHDEHIYLPALDATVDAMHRGRFPRGRPLR